MPAVIKQSRVGRWTTNENSGMCKPILRLLKTERGLDLIRCFEDMSLRDASLICKITFSSFKLVKDKMNYPRWAFHDLRAGRAGGPEKWIEIRKHRIEMMKVTLGAPD